jgi:murein DD-endopeptidase MepM/ murein hydrolase activator NlpD
LFKTINKLFIRKKAPGKRGFLKNPLFYFVFGAIFLFGSMYASCDMDGNNIRAISFFDGAENLENSNLFYNQKSAAPLETPDLKIIQDNTVGGVSTPSIVSGKVLGDVFGGNSSQNKKEIIEYTVQAGDTVQSVATANSISVNTLLWANDLTSSSKLKVGQTLVILPTDGVLHVVKSGDTISAIAQKYKAKSESIISYNDLANQDDIYIGDILVVPGGTMPKTSAPAVNNQVPLANNYFIYPVEGKITQGLHYYNAIDVANKCGTPVYAAAGGIVRRAVGNNSWNSGMGNYITIEHSNGTVTYYGHLQSLLVKPGESVSQGQHIGFVGNTGKVVGATGCHLHFQVVGAANPLSRYSVGANISYKK